MGSITKEKESIFKSIIDVIGQINENYRKSKLPKFIKKAIYKRNIRGLKETIYILQETYRISISIEDISEFIRRVYPDVSTSSIESPKPNKYNIINVISKNIEDSYSARFEFKILQNNSEYIIDVIIASKYVYESSNLTYIKYTMQSKDNKVVYQFSEEDKDIEFKKSIESYNLKDQVFNVEKEPIYIKDQFIDLLRYDMINYLLSFIERSNILKEI